MRTRGDCRTSIRQYVNTSLLQGLRSVQVMTYLRTDVMTHRTVCREITRNHVFTKSSLALSLSRGKSLRHA